MLAESQYRIGLDCPLLMSGGMTSLSKTKGGFERVEVRVFARSELLKRDWILMGVVVAGLGLMQGLAWAERWEFLGKHPEGDMYLDRESISQKGPVTQFTVKRVYFKPQESKVSQMKFQEQWVLQELDCGKHTMNMVHMIFADAKGNPVGAYTNLDGGPKPITPDGFFAKEAALLCNKQQAPQTAKGMAGKTLSSRPAKAN